MASALRKKGMAEAHPKPAKKGRKKQINGLLGLKDSEVVFCVCQCGE